MSNAERIMADFIDAAVGIIAPRRALLRKFYRRQAGRMEFDAHMQRAEMYAGAKTTRLTGAWNPAASNINDIVGASTPMLRSRIRQLIRDFPYLARAINVMVDYSIGTGIVYQSKVWNSKGKLDKKSIQKIEDAARWWMDEASADGKSHYYELMRLAKRQEIENGEFILVKTYPKIPNHYIPYALQLYDADWLTSAKDKYTSGGNDINAAPGAKETRQGIEYEKLTGRVTGYWFADPNYGGNPVYVSAENVVHGFKTLRPMQLRGVPHYAPGVLIANDLNSYLDAEIDAAKMAAKYLAIVTTPDPAGRQIGIGAYKDDNNKKIEELENAIIEYMRPGESINLAQSNRPGTTFTPFVRLLLTMLSITTDVPYELISGDYQGLNFSTAKIVRNDFSQQLRPISVRHVRQFGVPTITTAIDIAVLTGKLTLPGYWQNPRVYHDSEWQPPGMDAVDPLREAKGQIEAISYGLKSPQEVARERGRDLEDIYDEIAMAQEMAKEKGLQFGKAGLSEKNNPAAVEEQ